MQAPTRWLEPALEPVLEQERVEQGKARTLWPHCSKIWACKWTLRTINEFKISDFSFKMRIIKGINQLNQVSL